MIRALAIGMLYAALLLKACPVQAQEHMAPITATKGSTAFCLYELPPDEDGKRRWINLGMVQYLEFVRNELRIYYGGGNLGSGHEARLPGAGPGQPEETLEKIRQAAADCR
ncbi:conserved exported protein of unknown function [Georgfuchsia toluolica]|uniref:Uncharacterized protein n=1 Tax=Georgfuchsia toluolica TaxID=424218 RepID=A0A916JAE3_9PROT|nr:hypothetical protein [Georgfuchsia toluolica]CAG4885293.1 conserved exported protein of unknown function [Georgfuchsia toluolica]